MIGLIILLALIFVALVALYGAVTLPFYILLALIYWIGDLIMYIH